jgi:hypothetical protein
MPATERLNDAFGAGRIAVDARIKRLPRDQIGDIRGSVGQWRRCAEVVEKRVECSERRGVFAGCDGRDDGLIGARGFARGDQVLIAAISGPTPMIAITRLML